MSDGRSRGSVTIAPPHDNGAPVTRRLRTHLHDNFVAYVALCVAVISSGGSYAVAATAHHTSSAKHPTPTTLAACVNNRTGEMILDRRGRCRAGRHKVTWDVKGRRGATGAKGATGTTGAAGAPAPSIYASVNATSAANGLQAEPENGLSVQNVGTGEYTVTVTDPECSRGENVPTITPTADYLSGGVVPPTGATPIAYIAQEDTPTEFSVQTGFMAGGTFTAAGMNFEIQDTCLLGGNQAASK
jgi:hypothetical protein